MKRFTFAVLSLALVLVGLIGVIVCVTPSSSAQYKLIQNTWRQSIKRTVKVCRNVAPIQKIF